MTAYIEANSPQAESPLWANIYQAERQDLSNLYVALIAVITAIGAYVAAGLAYVSNQYDSIEATHTPNGIAFFLALSPLPAALGSLYHSVLALLCRPRSLSCQAVERILFSGLKASSLHDQIIGVTRGEKILDPKHDPLIGTAAIIGSLAGTIAAFGYAAFCMWLGLTQLDNPGNEIMVWISGTGSLLILVASALLYVRGQLTKQSREIAPPITTETGPEPRRD